MGFKLGNCFFHTINVNISVTIRPKCLRFSLAILRMYMQGMVSQNFILGLVVPFMK